MRLLCTASLCVLPGSARAQLPDLAEVKGQYVPPSELQSRAPAEVAMSSFDAVVNAPLPLSDRTFLIPGLAYHLDSLSYSSVPPSFTELTTFHSLEAPLLLVQLLPNDWALTFRIAPALAGDFEQVDTGLFRVGALVLGTHSFSPRLSLGGGGIVTYSFGSLLPLPVVMAEWKPFDGAHVLAFLPALVSAKYTFSQRFEIGVRGDVAGNSYAIRDARVREAWPCAPGQLDDPATLADETVPDPSACIDHVAYSVGVVGAFVGARLFESVWWTGFAGRTVFRRLDQQNGSDDPVSGGELTIPDAFVARTGLAWRIPTE